MAKHVEFGMTWQESGRQSRSLPDDVDASDREAVLAYLKSIQDEIQIPEGSYIGGSDEIDDGDILEVWETDENGDLIGEVVTL